MLFRQLEVDLMIKRLSVPSCAEPLMYSYLKSDKNDPFSGYGNLVLKCVFWDSKYFYMKSNSNTAPPWNGCSFSNFQISYIYFKNKCQPTFRKMIAQDEVRESVGFKHSIYIATTLTARKPTHKRSVSSPPKSDHEQRQSCHAAPPSTKCPWWY